MKIDCNDANKDSNRCAENDRNVSDVCLLVRATGERNRMEQHGMDVLHMLRRVRDPRRRALGAHSMCVARQNVDRNVRH